MQSVPAQELKECPFCGGRILRQAIKCKHCRSMLDGSAPRPAQAPTPLSEDELTQQTAFMPLPNERVNIPPPSTQTSAALTQTQSHQRSFSGVSIPPEFITIPKREQGNVWLLSVFTVGFYGMYLTAKNAQEVSFLTKKKRFDFVSIIILTIITIGVFNVVYQIILGYDLHDYSKRNATKGRNEALHVALLMCNILSLIFAFGSSPFLFIASLNTYATAVWALQKELNLYADIKQ